MQITIEEAELITAVKNYIKDQGLSVRNKELTVDFSVTRSPTTYRASIDISKTTDVVPKSEKNATPEPEPVKKEPEPLDEDGNVPEDNFELASKETEAAVEEVNEIVDKAATEPEDPFASEKTEDKPEKVETAENDTDQLFG